MVLEDLSLPFLGEDYALVNKTVREFCERRIVPNSLRWEENGVDIRAVLQEISKLGVLGINIPEKYGGQPGDIFAWITVLEELGYADAGIAVPVLIQTGAAGSIISEYGSEEIKERYLPAMAKGETIVAFGLTEAEVPGSSPGYLRTTARKEGRKFVIQGKKSFITNAGIADLYVLFARVGPTSQGHRGIGVYLVEKGPQVRFSPEPTLGISLPGAWGTLEFDDVTVPEECQIVPPPSAFKVSMGFFNRERVGNSSICNGIAQRAFDQALGFVSNRKGPNRTTGDLTVPFTGYESIRMKFADMASQIRASRLGVYYSGYLISTSRPHVRDVSLTKAFANETVRRVCLDALQLHGAYGFTRSSMVQKLLRDSIFGGLAGGTIEILKLRYAQELLGRAQDA